ncbi:MAG TPA: hypothetical protein PKZ70_07675 [Candidatus Atribacteria bacterium]|nr:hypothetical protein [Candidatus Atribacteria bacterium]
MITLEELARDLGMKPDELIKESLETFLRHKLKVIESELFLLYRRYGVRDVQEFDRMVQEGKFHEEDAFEDYFKFDNLEAERDLILEYLDKL